MSPLALLGLGMFDHEFVRHGFIAATPIALASGLLGYFVILRNQVFVSDVLSHVAFTGALVAYAFALDPLIGLFGGCVLLAVATGALGESARSRDVATGTVFAWVLGLGVFFLSIYTTSHSASSGNVAVKVLFGSIYGIDSRHALIALGIGGGIALLTLVVARPLLFASLQPDIAAARGLPVRALGIVFMAAVGVVVAEAVQVVGSLLIVGLIATPAAAALHLTSRPYLGLLLSAAIAVFAVWSGLTASYLVQRLPPSALIIGIVFAVYLLSLALTWRPRRALSVAGADVASSAD